MATSKVFIWVAVCTCVFASPTRRQFNTETTSSDPVILVTDEVASWDDSDDDFDLEGGGWMREVSASPSSSIPESPDYEDYDDEDEDQQSAGKDENSNNNSEFLFLQPTDTRLMLEDDDDSQPGIIKVRHTSKNTYSDQPQDGGNALETIEKSNSDDQFVFTIDDNDEEFDGNKLEDNTDDFVLEDSDEQPAKKMTKKDDSSSSSRREDDDDDDDDDEDNDDDDSEAALEDNNTAFDSPEEDAQVIYGDHVFLY